MLHISLIFSFLNLFYCSTILVVYIMNGDKVPCTGRLGLINLINFFKTRCMALFQFGDVNVIKCKKARRHILRNLTKIFHSNCTLRNFTLKALYIPIGRHMYPVLKYNNIFNQNHFLYLKDVSLKNKYNNIWNLGYQSDLSTSYLLYYI